MNSVEAYRLFHEGVIALSRAEQHGIHVDVKYCNKQIAKLDKRIAIKTSKIENSDFYKKWKALLKGTAPNVNSNPQLSKYLYDYLKLKPATTTKSGQGATDENALLSLNIPELNKLIEIRKVKKLKDVLEGFLREQVDGIMHPVFNLHLTKTFRSSSDNPNFQNIPNRDEKSAAICRKAIYASTGNQLMEIDYSGIEVAVSACYNKDPELIRYIEDPSTDMHGDMSEAIFDITPMDDGFSYLRKATKNGFVFPQFYGDYYKNCAENLACKWGELSKTRWKKSEGVLIGGIPLAKHLIEVPKIKTFDQFTEHVREIEYHFWNHRFKVYNKWKTATWEKYQKTGIVESLTGFVYSGLMDRKNVTNYPIQGSAFHCLLWSLIELDKYLREYKFKTRIIGQIHDSIVFDLYPSEKQDVIDIAKYIMCERIRASWPWIIVPLRIAVDIGDIDASWAELKEFQLD